MTAFDPIKAQKEELTGLVQAEQQLRLIAGHKESIIDEATHERDGLLKAVSVLKGIIAVGRERLRTLEAEAEREAKEGQ